MLLQHNNLVYISLAQMVLLLMEHQYNDGLKLKQPSVLTAIIFKIDAGLSNVKNTQTR